MKISFQDLLQKINPYVEKVRSLIQPPKQTSSAPLPMPAPVDKSDEDKFAKTVMPNSVRTIAADPAAVPPPLPSGPRRIAVGRTAAAAPVELPRAVAIALEPRVERVLSLSLEDVIMQMPEGYLKPKESFDASRRVLLKAAEIEKGMAVGRPSIAVATLYQQMPEIFMHTVPSSDASLVSLPFEKVMDELSNLQVRNDQATEQAVPQVETPFLKVTVEEAERFGMPMEPIVTTEMPQVLPMHLQPATAESIAAAEPEAAAREKFVASPVSLRPPMPKPAPEIAATNRAPSSPNGETAAPAARIPFTMPDSGSAAAPKKFGTGEPAFPRVPASSGPPVPPPSIAFEPAKEVADEKPAPVGPMLKLPLKPILQSLPPMQLAGDASSVAADATVSFPMAVIAPQLVTGRVSIPPKDFHAALPVAYRSLFLPDAIEAAVQLSLADVLANLPSDALRMRDDQEEHTQDEIFETPFSTKAAEDAERLGNMTEPPTVKPAIPEPAPVVANVEPPRAPSVAPVREPVVQKSAPVTQPPAAPRFDAKDAVAKVSALEDVSACNISFADGLRLAGNVPEETHIEGLSALAPTLLQKLEQHMLDTQLGALNCMTIHGEKSPVSFFSAGNICLTALHKESELSAESRRELASIARQLATTYAETPHVDH